MVKFMKGPAGYNGPDFSVEVKQIDVTGIGPEPDTSWRFIDAAGHGHHYDKGYPTLKEITEPCEEDGETLDRHVRWECPHCGEVIEPAKVWSSFTRSIPGEKRYRVGKADVTRETFMVYWRRYQEAKLQEMEEGL